MDNTEQKDPFSLKFFNKYLNNDWVFTKLYIVIAIRIIFKIKHRIATVDLTYLV